MKRLILLVLVSFALNSISVSAQITNTHDKAEIVGWEFGGDGTPLILLAGGTWKSVQKVSSFKLFYIGETPVTPGRLVKFVLIIVVGFLLSWFTRRLLLRIQRRREQIAQSSSFYTLGRILHYLIMTIARLLASRPREVNATSTAIVMMR